MKALFSSIPLKYRYYIPLVAGIMLLVVLITLYSVNRAKSIIGDSIRDMLTMELATMQGLFVREREHRIEKIRIASRIASEIFEKKKLEVTGRQSTRKVTDQITGVSHETSYHDWQYKGRLLFGDTLLVDRISGISGVSATLFQRIDNGFMRIATTIRNKQGQRSTSLFKKMAGPLVLYM